MTDNNSFYSFLIEISSLSGIIPMIFTLITLKYLKNYIIPIFVLVFISFAVEIINWEFTQFSQNNLYIFHLFTVVEFILMNLFYLFYFKQYFKPIIFITILPLFIIIAITEYYIKGASSMNNISTSVESILFVSYSLFLYFFVMKKSLIENLLSSSVFWLNSAVLIYFSGNLLLFIFSSYLAETENKNYFMLWATIHSFFNITFNLLLSIGFWKTREK